MDGLWLERTRTRPDRMGGGKRPEPQRSDGQLPYGRPEGATGAGDGVFFVSPLLNIAASPTLVPGPSPSSLPD